MKLNLRKILCLPEKQAVPPPAYKPMFRRKMTPEDLREENLGKYIWWALPDNTALRKGIFVGYNSPENVAVEECGFFHTTFDVTIDDCWIEMELEK